MRHFSGLIQCHQRNLFSKLLGKMGLWQGQGFGIRYALLIGTPEENTPLGMRTMRRKLLRIAAEAVMTMVVTAVAVCIVRPFIKLNDEEVVTTVPVQPDANILRPFASNSTALYRIELKREPAHREMRCVVEPNRMSRDNIAQETKVELERWPTGDTVPAAIVESLDGAGKNVVILLEP